MAMVAIARRLNPTLDFREADAEALPFWGPRGRPRIRDAFDRLATVTPSTEGTTFRTP